jgi:hypothetical protein
VGIWWCSTWMIWNRKRRRKGVSSTCWQTTSPKSTKSRYLGLPRSKKCAVSG